LDGAAVAGIRQEVVDFAVVEAGKAQVEVAESSSPNQNPDWGALKIYGELLEIRVCCRLTDARPAIALCDLPDFFRNHPHRDFAMVEQLIRYRLDNCDVDGLHSGVANLTTLVANLRADLTDLQNRAAVPAR